MKCGVRFCGGCNPRYDRGEALKEIEDRLKDSDIEFKITTEDEQYDALLIIGGCTNCCAGYDQFTWSGKVRKMWAAEHIEKIINELRDSL